ncbi:hypothetical protein [Spirosoma spitsbergense]|uniref:hypothetical protein n=1 Tax=Spirosoma spitsbergense TaxID=431554 RepID=UPI0003797E7A|nr:hypothetical protein [Spirosoma spitsbergense]
MRTFFYLFLLLALGSCSKKVMVRFKQKEAEITSKESLALLMLVNKSPKIVLRVPDAQRVVLRSPATNNKYQSDSRKLTGSQHEVVYDDRMLYNVVEKQLFENLNVIDRKLFNEVMSKASNVDYSRLNDLTNTDLILEWVNMDRQVPYTANECYQISKKGKEKTIGLENKFRRLGASIEFRLVQVKTNQMVGNYVFNYTPCATGCEYLYKGGKLLPLVKHTQLGPYEIASQAELEKFMTSATRQLVDAIR